MGAAPAAPVYSIMLNLDQVLARAGTDKYNAPASIQTGTDGYHILFDYEPAPQPAGMGRDENGLTTWNGYGLTSDGFSGVWYINPSGIDPRPAPDEVQNWMAGHGRRYASSVVYIPSWDQAIADANDGGGWVEVAAGAVIGAAIGGAVLQAAGALGGEALTAEAVAADSAAEATAGEFATEAYSANAAAIETGGTLQMGDLSNWLADYSSNPGADPFATTDAVNAGWTEWNGYGVDYYGKTSVSASESLNDIFGNVSKAVQNVSTAIKSASGALQTSRANLTAPAPNYQRAAGSINLGTVALAAAAFFAFRG